MGVVEHNRSGARFTLGARCLVGRAPSCALRLTDARVSAEHASLFWRGEWMVRDLGSSNGTQVNGRALAAGERASLAEGAELCFGSPEERWTLIDASPPIAGARSLETGRQIAAEHGLLAIPSAAEPEATVFASGQGGWLVDVGGAPREARDQERITLASGAWILNLPHDEIAGAGLPTTRRHGERPKTLDTVTLRFEVSRDEEYVELVLAHDGEQRLGARSHHYLLLTLARARLRDQESGSVPVPEQGWLYVDELIAMLATDLQQLNLAVFRARQQLAQAGLLDAGRIVERRSTTRQIRLGAPRLELRRSPDAG